MAISGYRIAVGAETTCQQCLHSKTKWWSKLLQCHFKKNSPVCVSKRKTCLFAYRRENLKPKVMEEGHRKVAALLSAALDLDPFNKDMESKKE